MTWQKGLATALFVIAVVSIVLWAPIKGKGKAGQTGAQQTGTIIGALSNGFSTGWKALTGQTSKG